MTSEHIVIIVLGAVALIFMSLAIFLGKEMMKKFGFLSRFAAQHPNLVVYQYPGTKQRNQTGMRRITLTSKEPCKYLVGFELAVPFVGKGFDYYGYVEAEKQESGLWVARIDTYLGRGAVDFYFLADKVKEEDIIVEVPEAMPHKLPPAHAVYPPHWWQRIGLWS